MILTRLYLESFGKFQDTEIKVEPGINLIYGKNEKGKSTIHKFIEAMFYGLNNYRYNIPDQQDQYFYFRPWKDKDQFSGELDFEEESNHIHMTRDFFKKQGIVVYENHGILPKADEDTLVSSESRKKSLSVLGIADISNKTGRSLAKEMSNRILNIRNANSGIISLDETLEEIQGKIVELEKNSDYFQLRKQLEYYNEKVIESENLQLMKKDFIESYFTKVKEINDINDDISRIRENIRGGENQATVDQYSLLITKNEEIAFNKKILEQLEPYKHIKVEEVESYLAAMKQLPVLEKEVAFYTEGIKVAKSKQDRITLDLSPRSIKVLSKDDFNLAFVNKFEEILKIKNELFDVEQKIYTNEEKLHETIDEKVYSTLEISTKSEKLEKDYFKFVNMVSWKEQIEKEQDINNQGNDYDKVLKTLQNKNLNFRAFMLIAQIVSILSILGSFIKPSQIVTMFIFFSLGILGAIVFKVKQSKVDKEIIDYKYQSKNIDEESRKNKKRLSKANEHIGEILAVYNCKSEEEFHLYNKEKKLAYENEVLYRKDLKDQEEKREMIVTEILSEENTVSDFFEAAYLFDEDKLELDKKTYNKVLFYIQASKNYKELEVDIVKLENKLKVSKEELIKAREITSSNIYQQLEISSIKDYQLKRETWVRVNEAMKTQIAQKVLLLNGEDEASLLRLGEDLSKIDNASGKEYNLKQLKELVMEKEERLIKVKRDATDAKYEAEKIANSQIAHSRIRKKIDNINGELRSFQEKISLYTESLELVKKASNKISAKFHDELKETLHHVVSEVIGEAYEVILEDDMRVLAKDRASGEIVDVENLSMGTIDQIYFALRIGLINSMDQNQDIPLILDDCFVHYDGQRLGQMLVQISALNRQVIMLTCHERERRIFDELGIKINYIEL